MITQLWMRDSERVQTVSADLTDAFAFMTSGAVERGERFMNILDVAELFGFGWL